MGSAPAAPPAPAAPAKDKVKSKFRVLARVKGDSTWTELPATYEAVEQGAAKGAAANDISQSTNDEFAGLRENLSESGKGVQFLAVSSRGYKPETFKLEAPKPRLRRS